MSRLVPFDRALSDDDRRYLRQLGAHGSNLEARIDADFPPNPAALDRFEREERKAAAELNGVGLTAGDQTDLMSENERLRAELERLRSGASAPNYSTWKKADLEAEVDRVNTEDPEAGLSKGTVAEMAAALTAYFSE